VGSLRAQMWPVFTQKTIGEWLQQLASWWL
jgi:hypothetical protein